MDKSLMLNCLRLHSVLLAFALLLGSSPTVHAQCVESEVWEISTRHLSCCECRLSSPENAEVNQWDGCRWQRRSMDSLSVPSEKLGIDPLTILYVHGNWMERSNAQERVRIIDRYIKQRACEPYRIIMLSWPSQHDHGFIREVRDNARCADVQSFYLAWLLQKVNATSSRVSILGFSFGARTVVGALQLESGGSVLNLPSQLTRTGSPQPHLDADAGTIAIPMHRVSLVAPAVDRDWLMPQGRYGLAMTRIDRLINLYNSSDPILRRFRFIDSITRPIAAGFAGLGAVGDPPSTSPLQNQDRIEQYDCRSSIGATHSELSYYEECPCFRIAVDNLLWK